MDEQIENNWYETFFAGLNCEMWERAVTKEWTENEVDFLIKALNVRPGDTLLDIPCGFGRHAIEIARRGFNVTGIDISAEFVQTLQEKVTAESLPVTVIQGDYLKTNMDQSFDGIYCLGNSFGYTEYDGMNTFVKNVSAVLKVNGRFVVNSGLVAESILTHFPVEKQFLLGDLTMDISNSYVLEESYMATELTYTKHGKQEKHRFKHYVYTMSEIRRLLQLYGMRIVDIFNSTNMTKYELGDQQMYLLAEKI